MKEIKININEGERTITVPCISNDEWEIKIYIETRADGSHELKGTTLRTRMEHEKGKITGITIG